jgi:hypothetical protein
MLVKGRNGVKWEGSGFEGSKVRPVPGTADMDLRTARMNPGGEPSVQCINRPGGEE